MGKATTDATGSFTVTYVPPSPPAILYLAALGGDAGSGKNAAIGLMTVAGISSAPPDSVTINELSTVAAQWALARFADSSGSIIGAPDSNRVGLAGAVGRIADDLVDVATGAPAGFLTALGCPLPPSPRQQVDCDALDRLDSVANIIAACVHSTGLPAGPCDTLFTNTGTPAGGTTLAAAHSMAIKPTANVDVLFALQGPSPPFAPYLGLAPDGWELALNFAPAGSNFGGPNRLAIDADGNVWATNSNDNSVTELNPSGGLAGSFAPTGANFDFPTGLAIGSGGAIWVANNGGNNVTELNPSGGLVGNFAPAGAGFNQPADVALDAAGNVWVTNKVGNSVTELNPSGGLVGNFAPVGSNFSFPVGVAIGAGSNLWAANSGGDSVTELSVGGGLVGNFAPVGSNFKAPAGVAIDPGGDIWVTNSGGDSVTELDPSGGWVGYFAPIEANFSAPEFVAIDSAGNVWVTNAGGNSVTELNPSGLVVNFAPAGANFSFPTGVAIDAAGDVWMANFNGSSVTEFIGIGSPVLTPMVACLKKTPPSAACLP